MRIEEDVVSGRTLNRPGLKQALGACRSGDVSGIVVAKLDRLSRSLVDFAGLLVEAQAKGFNIVALDLGVDLNPGRRVPRKRHGLGGPVGAPDHRSDGRRTPWLSAVNRASSSVARHSREDALSRRVAAMRKRGMTLQAIADKLNSEEVETLRGGSEWRPSSVRVVLNRKRSARAA